MNKQDLKMTDKHRKDLARRTVILILCVCLISYMFKILGSNIFNKFITNDAFIKASTAIDTILWLNILCYGLFGYIITQFTVCMTCGKLKLKWFEYIIIFILSIGMSALRYYFFEVSTYLFDAIQYVLFPVLYGSIFRKTDVLDNIMNALLLYFTTNGVILVNVTLCSLKAIMYTSTFIAYTLSLIEPYLFIIAFVVFINNGGFKNVKSNFNSK